MKKIGFFLMIFLFSGSICKSGDILYKVSDIPPELKENAHTVIRAENTTLSIEGQGKATVNYFVAITVLNKNGLDDANLNLQYNKYLSISNIRGRVFNENGEQIKKLNAEDIKDFSAIAGYSLYDDHRVKSVDPGIRQYPFTIEYLFEISMNGIQDLPDWFPQNDFGIALEKGSFKIIVPKEQEIRYLERNLPVKAAITHNTDNTIYFWELTKQKAFKYEVLSPSPQDYFPQVIVIPAEFEIGGRKGSTGSWKSLGDWVYELNRGKDVLLPETVAELNNMVRDCKTTGEKIARIYAYMQGRVRYVNLTIGMGGWQTIDAATVHRLSYGDCKALTNYMKALLAAVGVNSYYCWVSAGKSASAVIDSFPSFQFNHAILCAPVDGDTIWLECTSQHLPGGYLGTFTSDRQALLIDSANSHLVNTERTRPGENVTVCKAGIIFDETGSGSACISKQYSGCDYEKADNKLYADDSDKKKMISEEMIFPAFQLVDFKYDEKRSAEPSITETIHVNFENYLTAINTKFILTLNCTNRVSSSFTSSRNRKADIEIRYDGTEIDSLVYKIPATLKIENLPGPSDFTSPFGHYKSEVITGNDNLIYIRTLHINKGVFPASSYAELVDFIDKVLVADDEKCVFIMNN
jgi:hypothetical protein